MKTEFVSYAPPAKDDKAAPFQVHGADVGKGTVLPITGSGLVKGGKEAVSNWWSDSVDSFKSESLLDSMRKIDKAAAGSQQKFLE